MQKRWLTVGLCLLLIALLRYGSLNVEQSTEALTMWFETLVPSLFCVMVTVKVIFSFRSFDWLAKPFALLFSRLLRMNEQSFPYLVALSFLGFPAGAAFINDAVAHHRFTPKEGQRLIYTCSFATPGFVILTVGSVLFQSVSIGVGLFFIQLCSGVILLFLTRRQTIQANGSIAAENRSRSQILGSAVMESGKTLYMMGGYLMLCMSISAIVLQFLPADIQVTLRILTEFSSGTMQLATMDLSLLWRLVAISMLLSFGGFCVHMQVLSFSEETRLRYFYYLTFRIVQAMISGILAYVLFGVCHWGC